MAKFIHSALLESLKKNTSLFSDGVFTNEAKKSLLFADDHHIIVNGIDHKTLGTVEKGLSWNGGTLGHSNTSITANTAAEFRPIQFDVYGHIIAYGDAITPLVRTDIKTLTLNNGKEGADAKTIVFDPNTGNVISLTGGNNKFTLSDGTNTFDVDITPVITGGTTTAPTAGTVISTIEVSTSGVPSVKSTTNVADLVLGGYSYASNNATISNTSTIGGAINALLYKIGAIESTATGAMTFRGTADALPTDSILNGDTYKVTTSFVIPAASSATGENITPAVGDTIIAVKNGDTVTWSVVPSGDETFDDLSENVTVGDDQYKLKLTVDGTTKYLRLTGNSFGTLGVGTVFAGPTSGSNAVPTFRSLGANDIPVLDASKITSGTFEVDRIPTINLTNKVEGVLPVANGGTGKSSWTVGGLVYADTAASLSLITNLSGNGVRGILQQSTNASGVISYNYVTPTLVVASEAAGVTNAASTTTAYVNLTDGTNKYSGISIAAGTGLTLSAENGAITIGSTLTSNVTSAFVVAAEEKTINSVKYSTAKLTFTEGSASESWNIVGQGYTNVDYDASNKLIKITSQNTWRPVSYYGIVGTAQDATIDSLDTNDLKFSKTFALNSSNEIDIVWGEVDANGDLTYVI